ncbi:presenilin-associated rhomboid-like protein, mitochondrial isoform X2 [Prorops nasuta]|uniref:presenilin-associated rhomboid-like protein, mitochondrial isoform X2 n=1 Tax=Prorops nasuta TaxID=863751 RepID=UPI0034CF854B
MATRILLYYCNTTNRMITLPSTKFSKQIKGFKKFANSTNDVKKPFTNFFSKSEGRQTFQSSLWKPFWFTVMFSGATIVGAVICEYERARAQAYSRIYPYRKYSVPKIGWRGKVHRWWNSLSEGEKVFVPICFLNLLVCLAWRVPGWQKIMHTYFTANPAARIVCWPMLLSTFSHHSVLHFAINMYVLHTCMNIVVATLDKEQFMALYLCSGVFSSFTSHLYKVATGTLTTSVGASGAILGILAYICSQYPNIEMHVIFLPMFTITGGMALKGLMTLDTVGMIAGWKIFDHAAHLGGAIFGIMWYNWGNAHIWQKREPIIQFWHSLRHPSKKA